MGVERDGLVAAVEEEKRSWETAWVERRRRIRL